MPRCLSFEIYFEDIQKEILDQQDCADFFLGPYTISEDIDDYELYGNTRNV